MNEANEDDVVALPIGPDEIACLANTKVPDGSYNECTALRDDLWEYGQNNPVPAIFVDKDSAAEYVQSLEGRTGVISCHLQSATLNNGTKSVVWNRVDPRVSKEKFDVKFYMNYRNEKMSVQHHPSTGNDSKTRYRIDVPFNKVMGIEIADGVLTAVVFGSPSIEKRSESSRVLQVPSSNDNSTSSRSSRLSIGFIHHISPENLQRNLEKIPSLQSPFRSGICEDYPGFDPTEGENPHDRLPLLRDPTLVRAAQLAILQLRDHAQEYDSSTQHIVETFGGIEKRFRDLLKRRLLKKCLPTSRIHHEE